jgi:hypothetical protein
MPEAETVETLTAIPPVDWAAAEKLAEAHEAKRGVDRTPAEKPEKPAAKEPAESPAEAPEAPEAEAATEEPEGAEPAAEKPSGDTLKQLEELAKKHGYVLAGEKVLPEERAQLRAEKRKFREGARQLQADLDAKAREFDSYQVAAKRKADGDLVGAVEALGIDPNEFNRQMAGRVDPAFAERQKIQKELAELKAAREAEAAERQKAEAAQARQRVVQEHVAFIAATCQKSESDLDRELVKYPDLLERARAHAEQAWIDDQTDLPPSQAVAHVFADIRRMPNETVQLLRERLAFFDRVRGTQPPGTADGDRDSDDPESSDRAAALPESSDRSTATSAKPGRKPPKSVSSKKAAEASATAAKPFNHEAWKAEMAKLLEQADD